mgnify:FL=1|jgi:hypothetical protein
MKKFKNVVLFVSVASILASCSVAGPLMVSNHSVGPKRGEASRSIFLGITFGHTDLGAITAAKNGGIKKISTVDWKVSSKMFRTKYSTVVTGQ